MGNLLRLDADAHVRRLLRDAPVVALLGARQVGKTTLAQYISATWRGPVARFDLEDPRDVARLNDPMLALADCRGLVVLDEIQRRPDLFPILRVLADRRPIRCRFLVLGSASPDLLRQGAESLAGRIAFHELRPFSLSELGIDTLTRRWRRGGFPRAYLARAEADSVRWRQDFVRTYLEKDLPQLGITTAGATMRRFWEMLAHVHANILNSSELGRAFGVSDTTVRRYLETLEATFMVRLLRPYSANMGKRQVKAPKVYIADSGLLHTLLDIDSADTLQRHPKVGASWEGFMLDTVVDLLKARPEQCYFWATHGGAELDLLVTSGGMRRGFEFKRTSSPSMTPSMRSAMTDLALDRLDVIHAGPETFPLAPRVRAVAAADVLQAL
ncbi:MAG: ATP-binding protein [Gemmatimonadaceae bacterium]|nr:ATP-binding protein [Gemmatimonadaceae bacterium]